MRSLLPSFTLILGAAVAGAGCSGSDKPNDSKVDGGDAGADVSADTGRDGGVDRSGDTPPLTESTGLGLNDVTILVPLPKSKTQPVLLPMAGSAGGADLVPR